jgi:hypothetical protein
LNPFGELDLAVRSELAVVEIEPLVQRLGRPGLAVQYIGERGRGKTTHLLALLRRFPAARYVHVGEGESPRFGPSDPLFIDELQRVPRRQRRRLFRRGVSLVIGTHVDYRAELRHAGLEVETVPVGQRLEPAGLRQILNRRIQWARRQEGPVPVIGVDTAEALMRRFGDDVRAIEGHMYEIFQQLNEIRDV